MKLIFWGLVLSFFNFNLEVGGSIIGLLPDFLGYILIWRGAGQILVQSRWLEKLRGPAVFMAFITGADYLMNLFGIIIVHEIAIIFLLIGIIGTVVRVYILYCLTKAVGDIGETLDVYLCADKLHKAWVVIAICQAVDVLCLLMIAAAPDLATIASMMSVIASFVGYLWYLIVFYSSRKFYGNEMMYRARRGEAQDQDE